MDALNFERNRQKMFQVSLLSLMSDDGVTGDQWIEYFKKKNIYVSGFARSMLESHTFYPTTGINTLNVAILKGEIFKPGFSFVSNVFDQAIRRMFLVPSADLACYLLKNFSSGDMKSIGVEKVLIMSRTIEDHEGDSCYFRIIWNDDGPRLEAHKHDEGVEFDPSYSFAFYDLEESIRKKLLYGNCQPSDFNLEFVG